MTNKNNISNSNATAQQKEKLHRILCEQFFVDTEYTEDTLFDTLRLDSLDIVEMVMAVEDEFKIEIQDSLLPDEIYDLTVGMLLKIIVKLAPEQDQ